MKIKMYSALAWAAAMFLVCVPLWAHHGASVYESDKLTTLTGTVTEFKFMNPHSEIFFDVKDDKGNVQHWSAEAGTPQTVILAGWSKTSIQKGDVITVYIFQAKTGNPVGRLNKIVLADGTELRDSALGYRDADGAGKQ